VRLVRAAWLPSLALASAALAAAAIADPVSAPGPGRAARPDSVAIADSATSRGATMGGGVSGATISGSAFTIRAEPDTAAPDSAAAPVSPAADTTTPPPTYGDSLQAWRDARVKRLTSDTGWLSVAGLYWLSPGENTFGTDSSNAIVLPRGSAPARCGAFHLARAANGDRVTLRAAPKAEVRLASGGDSLVTERVLATDVSGGADMLKVGRLTMFVIKRGDRLAIRMRDPESPLRKEFVGVDFYPIDPGYRIEAIFETFDSPRMIPVPNIAGYADSMIAPGVLRFTVDGMPCTLTPVHEGPSDSTFFIIFRDQTTEVETYGGGRFLYADPPRDGRVVLDFNRAYNPPCAFTPFTTCPMPPDGNDLAVAVRAGEKKYGRH
jgi:uncharacterized protein (DUF1684 family)